MVTVRDVAKKSGVGIATVSRVINGNYPVSEETRQNVLRAIQELEYRPNEIARSLKTRKSRMVGVVVADLSNVFFMQFVKGLEDEVSKYGYNVIIASHNEDASKERRIIEMFIENNVAAIVTTTSQQDGRYFESLKTLHIPVILADRTIDGYTDTNYVVEDNEKASRQLIEHVIAMGHRRIAITKSSFMYIGTAGKRYSGYEQALRGHGIEPNPLYILESRNTETYDCVKNMLTTLNRADWPTAIFAINNGRMENTLRAVLDLNIKIPEDISLVSYGDITYSWLIEIKLTHVRQEPVMLGVAAGKLIVQKAGDEFSGNMQTVLDSSISYGNSVKKLV